MANTQTVQVGQNAGRGVSAAASTPHRVPFRVWPMALFAASFAVSWVPVFGGMLAHPIDRMKNRADANYELGVRAKYYAEQIGTTLGMSPDRVGRADLLKAASINPELRRVVTEVENKRGNENKSSLFVNAGVTAASMVGMGGAAKIAGEVVTATKTAHAGVQIAKVTAGALAGGAVAGVLSKNEIKAQELIEATEQDMLSARAHGQDARAAINPQITFMIRAAQDEVLSKEINKMSKQRFGKMLHQLDPQQISLVMNHYPDLSNATLREAHAIANGDMSIRDLAGAAPNMGGGFAGPMARADNARGSFVGREEARRSAAAGPQGLNA